MRFVVSKKWGLKYTVLIGALCLLVPATFGATIEPSHTISDQKAGIAISRSDDAGFAFSVRTGFPLYESQSQAGMAQESISLAGFGKMGVAGYPALPMQSYTVAVPPGAEVSLEWISAETPLISHHPHLQPAPTTHLLAYDFTDAQAIPEFEQDFTAAPAALRTTRYPTTPVTISQANAFRDWRLVDVTVYPLQYNAVSGELRQHTELQITLTFSYPQGKPSQNHATRPESEVFKQLLAANVLNFDSAETWHTWQANPNISGKSPCLDANAYRIAIDQSSMYRITSDDLVGLPSNASSVGIRMCYNDTEIPILMHDTNANAVFDRDDYLIFYGESLRTHSTETNIYWLTYGGQNGLRMSAESAAPANGTLQALTEAPIHLETDTIYYPQFPLQDPDDLYDHWFQQQLVSGDSVTLNFEVNNKVDGVTVKISAEVWGFASIQQHRFRLSLNGIDLMPIGEFVASGKTGDPFLFSLNADSALLINGQNNLTLEALPQTNGSAHAMLLNWIAVTPKQQLLANADRLTILQADSGDWVYPFNGFTTAPLAFDVSDPTQPTQLGNMDIAAFEPSTPHFPARYELTTLAALPTPPQITKDTPSNLRAASNSADYIIITDPALINGLNDLIAYRESQGLKVEVAYVQDIFDEFSYGVFSQKALRDFSQYAYENWIGADKEQPAAPTSYLLLAGDGSHDPRDVLGHNDGHNYVPVFNLSGIDSFLGETAADNQYVAFNDETHLPFMLLGRLPAENVAEMQAMVSKTIAYETTNGATDNWRRYHLFVSDNSLIPSNNCTVDGAGDFISNVETFLANHFPQGESYQKLFYAPPACYSEQPPSLVSYDSMVIGIPKAINEGRNFVVYTGHSGLTVWGHEKYLDATDLNAIDNGGKTPILLPMTCLEGSYHRFDLTGRNGLSEAMVKMADSGAVASFAPTGLQVQTGHEYLLEGFYAAVYEDGIDELGAAVFAAKWHLKTNSNSFQDLHDTFMLLGDPALQINASPYTSRLLLPAVSAP